MYTNLMTKFNVLAMIGICKQHGATVVLGGPEPPYYAADYLERGADVIVIGEGEQTLEELIPHLAKHGVNGLDAINGIAFRGGDGTVVETAPRAFMADLSANPWADREAIQIEDYMRVWKGITGEARYRSSTRAAALHLYLVQPLGLRQHSPPPHARRCRRRAAVDQGAL
ncbi:MAG: hypothetical protein U0521_01610 [Anaerolineae bacterium]